MTVTGADDLLKTHREIMDAWFARWLEQERRRIETAFAKLKTM